MLALCLLGVSCRSDEGSSGTQVNWESLATPAIPGYQGVSIQRMESLVGFQLVLPSELPKGFSGDVLLPTESEFQNHPSASETAVLLLLGMPMITIQESRRQGDAPSFPSDPDAEATRIGQTDVRCGFRSIESGAPFGQPAGEPTRDPGRNPALVCRWESDELGFEVSFDWELAEPVPGLMTSDMRDEAMKVVTSMIEHPYTP
jgi:hypothetical protein